MYYLETTYIVLAFPCCLFYYPLVADEYIAGIKFFIGGKNSAQYFVRGVITAHYVNDNSHLR